PPPADSTPTGPATSPARSSSRPEPPRGACRRAARTGRPAPTRHHPESTGRAPRHHRRARLPPRRRPLRRRLLQPQHAGAHRGGHRRRRVGERPRRPPGQRERRQVPLRSPPPARPRRRDRRRTRRRPRGPAPRPRAERRPAAPGPRRRIRVRDVRRRPAALRRAPRRHPGTRRSAHARLPTAENLAATRVGVDWAHARGLWIEAELGDIGGKDGRRPLDAHAPGARTAPDQARAFVADSGVDALAVAVGTTHAMTTRTASVDHALLKRLSAGLDVPLVLHGSSGLPDTELAAAVAGGIAKVNVGTALNIAMTGAIRQYLAAHPEAVDSRRYLTVGREAMARAVADIVRALGTAEPTAHRPPARRDPLTS